MAGTRNLHQSEAIERARLLSVTSYDITLDLTDGAGGPGAGSFRSTTVVTFTAAEPGGSTFIEVGADALRSATLNGAPVDLGDWSPEKGLTLSGLAAENTLVVDGDFPFSSAGQGLHRSVDPVDQEVYLYSQFEAADAQRTFACFDQPDLKAVYTWHATVPQHWKVVSNAPVARTEATGTGATTVHFEQSARMSTYVTALCAGPYHEVRTTHDGIDLGFFVRDSMKQFFDVDDLILITTQGFDFYHQKFGVRYPLPKYDQLWVPDFNAGAMENFGCITHAEAHYIFRSKVTNFAYEQRANTILHELAHMWFGDLVTMRWWDDLWLNESFAEWASHWCNTEATRFADAWTTFLSIRKNWGYQQDQLSTTHPVYTQAPDLDTAEGNFDGITYAKGASILKQLVAYVGIDPFLAGLRSYFAAHAWGNATFGDLLTALEASSGRSLREFAAQWLETVQVNTLRPVVSMRADGTYEQVSVAQEAPASAPTLRTHRIGIGLYDLVGEQLVRRDRLEIDVAGASTAVPALTGVTVPDVLLLNDDDLTYAKLRLDERSLATVVRHISGFDSSLARALVWAAAWDQVRDAELAARDYVRLVATGLPAETDINLVTGTLRQVQAALTSYVDPAWAPTGWALLADTALAALRAAQPGGGFQLSWAHAFATAARTPEQLAIPRAWLSGNDVPAGLTIDTDLRWSLLGSLVAKGAATPDEIEAELARDRTSAGEREAAVLRALIPTPESKAATWARLTSPEDLPNWLNRALGQGFQHSTQVELTAPYATTFFDAVDAVWDARSNEVAQEFVMLTYPNLQVAQSTVDATDAWLAQEGHKPAVRRLVAEGRDRVVRALAARARDAAAG